MQIHSLNNFNINPHSFGAKKKSKKTSPVTASKQNTSDNKNCVYCGSEHLKKDGKLKDGTQRYVCKDCHKGFSDKTVVSKAPVTTPVTDKKSAVKRQQPKITDKKASSKTVPAQFVQVKKPQTNPVQTAIPQSLSKIQTAKPTVTHVVKPVEKKPEPKKITTVNLVSKAENPVSNKEIYETLKKHLSGEVKYDRKSAKEFVDFIYDNKITFSDNVRRVDSINDLQKNLADIEIKNDENSWRFLGHLVGKLYDTGKIPKTGDLLNSYIMTKSTYFVGDSLSYCTDMTLADGVYIGKHVTKDTKLPLMYLMGTLKFQDKEDKNISKLLDDVSADYIETAREHFRRNDSYYRQFAPKVKSADMLIQYWDGVVSSENYDYIGSKLSMGWRYDDNKTGYRLVDFTSYKLNESDKQDYSLKLKKGFAGIQERRSLYKKFMNIYDSGECPSFRNLYDIARDNYDTFKYFKHKPLNDKGETILHLMVQSNQKEHRNFDDLLRAVHLLNFHDFNFNVKDNDGHSAIYKAIELGDTDFVKAIQTAKYMDKTRLYVR